MESKLTAVLIEKLMFPLILAIIGWFVKDYLLAIYARRDELVRKEWEMRLIEVWSPLYYWFGIVMLSGNQIGWERHGLKELEAIIARSAHLLPIQHYNCLIKLIQALTYQKTTEPTIDELKSARAYIYKEITILNYMLYRKTGWFEATTYTDFFASVKYLVRFAAQALRHIVIWLIIVVLFVGTYIAFISKMYWIVIGVLIFVSIPILYEWHRQIRLHKELNQQK